MTSRPLLLALTCCGFAIAAGAACRQVAGIHERSSEQTVCADCIDTSCKAPSNACKASPSCASRVDCALGCDPTLPDASACQATCAATAAADVADLGAVNSCAAKSCASDCAIRCGGVLPLAPPEAATACSACVAAQCCQQASDCAAIPDCLSGLECARGESTPDAVQTCTDLKYAAGSSAYHAMDDCMVGACSDECVVGADWSCVGHVTEPVAPASTIRGTVHLVEASAQNVPIQGLNVVGCEIEDTNCENPLTPVGTSDANGAVTLLFPTSGPTGNSSFKGYVQISDPTQAYLTELGFVSPEATQPGASDTLIVVSVSQAQLYATALFGTGAYDSTKAALLLTAVDCANRPAADVSFTIQTADGADVPVFYLLNELPKTNATATDSSGTAIAGYANPGTTSITVRSLALGKTVAVVQVIARAGAETLTHVGPNQ